jgi:hypothetical protein
MDANGSRQRINALFGKYKYPILVVLVGLVLLLSFAPLFRKLGKK